MAYKVESMNTVHYKEVSSTMDVVLDHILEDTAKPILVISNQQTRGRGRYDSAWFSPLGGLYMTYAFPLMSQLNSIQLRFLHYAAALGVQQVLKNIYSVEILVKWPNDIYYKNRKLGGILIELVTKKADFLLLGIGVNISRESDISQNLDCIPAVFLEDIIHHSVKRDDLVKLITESLFSFVNLTIAEDYEKLVSFFNENSLDINRKFEYQSSVFKCIGISETGLLKLESSNHSYIEIQIDQSNNLNT